jgi:NACHT domain-containing protein
MAWNSLDTIAAVASITGLGTSIAQWLDARLLDRRRNASAARSTTIDEYLEWLRRRDQAQLVEKLDQSQEMLQLMDVFIRGLSQQSEARMSACMLQIEKSTENFETLLRRFAAVERQLNLFAIQQSDLAEDKEFEAAYLRQVRREFERLRILGVREARDVKQQFGLAYVSLAMSATKRTKETVTAEEALQDSPLMTIRGAAGSGKTTLLSWVALQCACAEDADSPWFGGVPFFIALRKLDSKERKHPNMTRFAEYTVNPNLWALTPPRRWLHRVLDSKRAVILIDGVDELPSSDRPDFWRWLDDFVDLSPGNRVYVTSRFFPERTGEKDLEPWCPPRSFVDASIEEMNDATLLQFIRNWHSAVVSKDLYPEERLELQQASESLPKKLRELSNRRVRELCRTPLLCALVCALHWREAGYLPKQRVDLYDRCCAMLIEERDLKRGISPPEGPLSSLDRDDKELLLQRLALDMMRNCDSYQRDYNIEVSRSDATTWIEPNIRLLDDSIAAQCSADEILDYLIVRTGLLREPSTGRVDFSHRTFQEYLAACAAGALNQVGYLVSRIDDDQWHETIVLAAGTKVGGVGFGNTLLDKLVAKGEAAKDSPAIRRTCFVLAVACLETARQVEQDLRSRVLGHLDEIVPPMGPSESRTLASAGEAILPWLTYERWRDSGVDVVAACAHTVAIIGNEKAIDMLIGPKGYGTDRRSTVLARVCECWAIDPVKIPRIARILEDPLNSLPPAVRPFVRNLDAVLPIPGTVSIELSGYSAVSDLAPLSRMHGVHILELSGLSAITNLDVLASLSDISLLRITNCPGVVDISPLSGLRKLGRLELNSLSSLEDLSPLSRMGQLQILGLRGFRNLNLAVLSKMSRLKVLDLRGSRKFSRIDALNSLPSLSDVIVDNSTASRISPDLGDKVTTVDWIDERAALD